MHSCLAELRSIASGRLPGEGARFEGRLGRMEGDSKGPPKARLIAAARFESGSLMLFRLVLC